MPLLEVRNLEVEYATRWGAVKAVDKISFTVEAGETVGLIGESGCGKSSVALSILGLVSSPRSKLRGEVAFQGANLLGEPEPRWRQLRGSQIALIFQNPFSSLNPVLTVGSQVAEAVRAHDSMTGSKVMEKALRLLELAEIPHAEERMKEYPHQLSGGMRQRVMIAMALAGGPKLLIADEPTTALDATTQSQILELLGKVQGETGSAMVIISHDLGVVASTCERVLVMYAGRIVEQGAVEDIYRRACHPYTQGLLNSVASLHQTKGEKLRPIQGSPPNLANLPPGCAFSPRCSKITSVCTQKRPELHKVAEGHWVACYVAAAESKGDASD